MPFTLDPAKGLIETILKETLGLERLLGDGGKLVEALDILIGHLGEHLTVKLDAGNLETVHELRVGNVVHAGGSVDAGNPEAADLTLLVTAIAVLVLEGVLHLLLSMLVRTGGSAIVALGLLQDGAMVLTGVESALHTCHI